MMRGFVSGNVPLPSAYSNSTQEGEEPHKRNAVAELTSYLSMALEVRGCA